MARYPEKSYTQIPNNDFVISEANGTQSREQILLYRGARIEAGTVLGKIGIGAMTVAAPVAGPGNTGNGTFAAQPTADAGAMEGVWQVVITEPAANAGTFEVRRPDGTLEAKGNVAVAYNGAINFTLQDGATDFVAGDSFNITVDYADGSGLWKPLDLAAVDGSQNAAGILRDMRDALTGADTRRAVAYVRSCDVNGKKLIWPAGITVNQRKAAEAQLGSTGVLVRY